MSGKQSLWRQYVVAYMPKVPRKRPPEVSERNWEIFCRFRSYEPMAAIAYDTDLSRERILQIISQTIKWGTGVSFESFKKELI